MTISPEEMLRNLNVLEAMQSFLAASAAGQPGNSGPSASTIATGDASANKSGEGEAANAPPPAPTAVDLD